MSLLLRSPFIRRTCWRRFPIGCRRRSILISARRLSAMTDSTVTLGEEASGAWTLLSALEKSIEAQGVQVARLVSSLEVLLPRPTAESSPASTSQSNNLPGETNNGEDTAHEHTNDPGFFAFLPHMNSAQDLSEASQVKREHILDLLHATRHGRRIAIPTLKALIVAATWQNQKLPNIISLPPLTIQPKRKRVTVVGDLHGSLSDLEAVLAFAGEPSETHTIIFNGDLADRGDHGIEVISIVCALFLAYPNRVFINRGNHEDIALSIAYGLALEIQYKYGSKAFQKHFSPILDEFFRSLPLAAMIEQDALIVHAGPPPPGVGLTDVEKLERTSNPCFSKTVRSVISGDYMPNEQLDKSLSDELILESLMWSDPSVDKEEGVLKDNRNTRSWKPNKSRGAGFRFDSNIIREFLEKEGLNRLIRSHEQVWNGCVRYPVERTDSKDSPLEFFTVFSASRYPNKEGFNRGAILTLLPEGQHQIRRYETEDDEPVMELSNVLASNPADQGTSTSGTPLVENAVDLTTLRRVLSEAIASNRSSLEESLFQLSISQDVAVESLPFHDAVDVLVDVLHLDSEDFAERAPRLALARALSMDSHRTSLPETIDLLHDLDQCLAEQDGDSYSIHLNWLHALFSLVDADHDGMISKEDWDRAVVTINAQVPRGGTLIDGEQSWELLDFNGNGFITAAEWDSVLLDVSLTLR